MIEEDVYLDGAATHQDHYADGASLHGPGKPGEAKRDIENLVFRGGGIKGLAYCGALEILRDLDILHSVKRYAGTSAGAIMAGLLAVGYTVEELERLFRDTNFATFKDGDANNIISKAEKLFKNFGVYKGKVFNDWLGTLLAAKMHNADITFDQLHSQLGVDLVIVGTCITHMAVHYFSHYTTPDMSIRDAIRISMSIPLFFEPVRIEDHIFVDGGVTDNFPLSVFDSDATFDPENSRNTPINMKTLGLYLVEDKTTVRTSVKVTGLKDYVDFLLQTVKRRIANLSYKSGDEHRTIVIQGRHLSSVSFDISDEEKGLLYHEGQRAARKFFGVKEISSPGSPSPHNCQAGHLIVKLKSACSLRSKLCNTFINFTVGSDVKKSTTKYKTANPAWNQVFVFRVLSQKESFRLEVIDQVFLRSPKVVCSHEIPLTDLTEGFPVDMWLALDVGKVNVELTWSTSF